MSTQERQGKKLILGYREKNKAIYPTYGFSQRVLKQFYLLEGRSRVIKLTVTSGW
jgi:hypothetical protein